MAQRIDGHMNLRTTLALGAIIAVPVVFLVFRIGATWGALVKSVENLVKELAEANRSTREFMDDTYSRLKDHGERIATIEGRWDGSERRLHERRTGS